MFGGPGGAQFVFNLGGGPGIRVHQFGGARPRRRPREANEEQEEGSPSTFVSLITNLLPIIVLFILPLLSSVFSGGDSASSLPEFRFQPAPPYDSLRTTPRWKLKYYVNERDIVDYPVRKLNQLDQRVEASYVSTLQYQCQSELQTRNRLMQQAQGWFFQDAERLREARNMDMTSCRRLENLGIPLNNLGAY
jgi:DnaJ homolog subfamily B member 12